MSFRFRYRLWGFVAILLLHYSVNAQPSFAKVWDRTYTGGQLYSAKPTYDGGYIMCGVSYVGIAGDKTEPLIGHSDIWVVKADSLGNKEWDRTIGGNFVDGFSKVFPARDSSGFLLCIASSSNLSGNKTENSIGLLQSVDYWIVKLDNHGVVVWDKTIGAYDSDYPVGIEQTPDGGLVILGESNSDNTGHKTDTVRGKDFDLWVVKLDSSRNILWDKTIGGMDVEYARCITTDKHGNIIVGGVTASDSGIDVSQVRRGGMDYFVVKIDANGEIIWNKRYGGDMYNDLSAITATHDGGFVLLGYSTSGIGGDKTTPKIDTVLYYDDYWLVKVDSNGEKQWDRSYGGIGYERTDFGAIYQSTDRGFLLSGYSRSQASGDKSENNMAFAQLWAVKTDYLGNLIWDKTIQTKSHTNGGAVIPLSGQCYVATSSVVDGSGGYQSLSPFAYLGYPGYWLLKICDTADYNYAQPQATQSELNILPNPSSNFIQLQSIHGDVSDVKIFSSNGQLVKESSDAFQIDVSNLLPSVYVIRASAGGNTYHRKLVKSKD